MANRKLQTEIERVFKKVSEGMELFEELFDKTVNAPNAAQKEKFEQDLKKEIKKLQRLRDQIKTWQASSEIKDKRALLDNRKLIENQMERFKVLEREIKTKQYSKEGLQAKEKLDPGEVAKSESAQWISSMVDKINTQIDAFEAEMEAIKLAKGKKKDTARLGELNQFLERHKFHITKLETMLRMLENDAISVDDVETVKDNVEYYVDSNQEPDFMEDEEMYDHLNLIEDDTIGVLDDHQALESPEVTDDKGSRRSSKEDDVTSPTKGAPSSSKSSTKASAASAAKATSSVKAPALPPPQPLPAPKPAASKTASSTPAPSVTLAKAAKVDAKPEPVVATKPELSFSKVVAAKLPQPPAPAPTTGLPPLPAPASTPSSPATLPATHAPTTVPTTMVQPPSSSQQQQQQQPISPEVVVPPAAVKAAAPAPMRPWSSSRFPAQFTDLIASMQAAKSKSFGNGDEVLRNQHLLQILESSFHQCPDLIDSERPRPFVPTEPAKTPVYYPQKPFLAFDMPTVSEKLDLDTLFFIFYYQQGTRQQYLAARELKRQSWRFHKKYLTWFQRHEEPKAITEEYEQGTYIYFDYEGAWCQRKKSEFTFEYRYLEDE